MLTAAFTVLALAVLLGALLAVLHMREGAVMPAWQLGTLHGLLAVGGFGALLLALRGPPHGLDQGTGSFGMIAAVLLALTAVAGAGFIAARLRRRRLSGALIGIHAMLAVSGFVILAAYVFAG
jgi:hypothetical protein